MIENLKYEKCIKRDIMHSGRSINSVTLENFPLWKTA